MKKASYFETNGNNIKCLLCPVGCMIPGGEAGFCRVRKNIGGQLYSDCYGKITSVSLDPIEKKPLKRFYPGNLVLSVGSSSCNMRCSFCQNHGITMSDSDFVLLEPEAVALAAKDYRERGNIGVAYTYNEPFINFEYMYDTAKIVHSMGMKNIIVTNGYVNEEPLREMLCRTDAMNIDIKGFDDKYYRMLNGRLSDVCKTVSIAQAACHVEITTLIIPGENDCEHEMREEAKWLASLRRDIPLHLSRFFPDYLMLEKQITPKETLYRLKDIASEYLDNVFVGNV